MKKNGFVSTTLIYTFFVLFLLLMIFLLNSYSRVQFLLDNIKSDIRGSFAMANSADINLYIYTWNNTTKEYELSDKIPTFGYDLNPNVSYCKNGSTLTYSNNNLSVTTARKDSCYAYFDEVEKDIILNVYVIDEAGNQKEVNEIPNFSYDLTSQTCTNGAKINFDVDTRRFTINTTEKAVCDVVFTKKEADVILHIYKQNINGTHVYDGDNYKEVMDGEDFASYGYEFKAYLCQNDLVNTEITYQNGEIIVDSDGKNECSVYFTGNGSSIDIIIMQESSSGVKGYTTGKTYVRTYTVPTTNYKYVGYICDTAGASVTYNNGILSATGDTEAICRAYFDQYSGNYYIHHLLEKSDGSYEEVSIPPQIGYNFNQTKSQCNNGSAIYLENGIVVVDSNTDNEECYAYYDIVNADIIVNVYVMNKTTNKFEIGTVPVVGYEILSKACTNGATIDYQNGFLKVTTIEPTVCTVYFR